mgnify:CR=1 FL=1|tara:strand:+ start:496 stop:1176 length:681 start_codon:yes stop_codon:yes gene_type:complete
MASEIKANTISEVTSANGVSIDGVNLKDSAINTGAIGSSVTGNWGWKLLETKTATAGDANIRIGSGTIFSSTYNLYKVVIDNWRPNVDGQIMMKWYINADNSLQEANYDYVTRGYDSGEAVRSNGSNSNSRIALVPTNINASSNTANDHCYAEISIQNPSVSSRHIISFMGHYLASANNSSTYFQGTAGLARHGIGGTFNGILFYPSGTSANLQAVNIRTYGVVNA